MNHFSAELLLQSVVLSHDCNQFSIELTTFLDQIDNQFFPLILQGNRQNINAVKSHMTLLNVMIKAQQFYNKNVIYTHTHTYTHACDYQNGN